MQEQHDSTVTLMVKPSRDNAVVILGNEIIAVNIYAQKLVIKGDDDLKRVTNDLSLISGLKKSIEEKRKEYLGPLQHYVKEVNNAFKLLTEPLNTADQTLRDKVQTYRHELGERRKEEERINELRMEAARAEMALKGELTEEVGLVEVSSVPSRISTDAGTIGTARVRKWEVEDFSKIPDEYKMVDAAKIGRVVRAGISNIPGIKIWEEESLRVRPRN